MSYNTGATLDRPDMELQQIREKLYRGQTLTKKEQARWANRVNVERETQRTGGAVQESVLPPATGGKPVSAYDAGRMETGQAQDYLRGRDEVLRQGPGGPMPIGPTDGYGRPQAPVRRSQVLNDAPAAAKNFDNGLGPHMGADGQPATWNVPKTISGRMNGANINEGAGLPDGTIGMMGADGKWKAWKGGGFTDDRFSSLADVGAGRRITPPAATPAGPGLNEGLESGAQPVPVTAAAQPKPFRPYQEPGTGQAPDAPPVAAMQPNPAPIIDVTGQGTPAPGSEPRRGAISAGPQSFSATPREPIFPRAVWNSPASQPKQYGAATEPYNPFQRRRVNVLPE